MKSFKIVQMAKCKRKLVAYYETWESMREALDTKQVWDRKKFQFVRHSPPSQSNKNTVFKKKGILSFESRPSEETKPIEGPQVQEQEASVVAETRQEGKDCKS
ncbi:hypothetical protein C1646_757959 [Rhizophagus diaphanus]|nr:hypothetical protein C1646_757959 [Rhizophagus diaphanus] [Rhizophagus sp. MUCL 43196]